MKIKVEQSVGVHEMIYRDNGFSVDINEFMRGFILTTKGDLQTKVEYTFRIYDVNGDNQISGQEIEKMAQVGNDR